MTSIACSHLTDTSTFPTVPGFYWAVGISPFKIDKPELVRVFMPTWTDPAKTELAWQWLDGSGDYPIDRGIWTPANYEACVAKVSQGEPESGELRLCILCAYDKPWGVWDARTGAAVCKDCRDAARSVTA
jgi:hypothetical protein